MDFYYLKKFNMTFAQSPASGALVLNNITELTGAL